MLPFMGHLTPEKNTGPAQYELPNPSWKTPEMYVAYYANEDKRKQALFCRQESNIVSMEANWQDLSKLKILI